MRVRTLLLAAALGLLTLSGCQKLNFEKTYTMEPATYQELTFDPPRYEQKVKVTITPSKGPVTALLIKPEGLMKIKSALDRDKAELPAEFVYGKHLGKTKEEFSFEATVPAKTEYLLLIKNGDQANEVSVKVVGR